MRRLIGALLAASIAAFAADGDDLLVLDDYLNNDGATLVGTSDSSSDDSAPPSSGPNTNTSDYNPNLIDPSLDGSPLICNDPTQVAFDPAGQACVPLGSAVTLSDIAHFTVSPTMHLMEPNGWVIAKLPANFYSTARTEIVTGTLFDAPADVRFTPIAWHWDYGDGTTATVPTPGGTWHELGLNEFDVTPTSHTYRTTGTYTVRLSITYRAEYRINGGPFLPIAGTLTRPSNDLHIRAGTAKTVLVDENCIQNPHGPGC